MLRKLLKYDLKWEYKVLIVFYTLALLFAALTRLFFSIENSLMFNIMGQIVNGAMISMMISGLINCFMRSWVRFINNIYKDESYLTHTLPVNKKNIYLSKVLTALICSFTTIIVALVCLFISYYSETNIEALKSYLKITADAYNISVISLILIVSFVIFLETLFEVRICSQ